MIISEALIETTLYFRPHIQKISGRLHRVQYVKSCHVLFISLTVKESWLPSCFTCILSPDFEIQYFKHYAVHIALETAGYFYRRHKRIYKTGNADVVQLEHWENNILMRVLRGQIVQRRNPNLLTNNFLWESDTYAFGKRD